MVVDMELEEAKNAVLKLMGDKDQIEADIKAQKEILDKHNIGMSEPLIDAEGYPRNDIDVYEVRQARAKIIRLQNDHKELMSKIERGLHRVHEFLGGGSASTSQSVREPSTAGPSSSAETNGLPLEPFLRVNLVTPESPASQAGIQVEDLILEFGSISLNNFNDLNDIGSLVKNSVNKEIVLKIRRGSSTFSLNITPRPWSGNGLLGCNVVPIENVER